MEMMRRVALGVGIALLFSSAPALAECRIPDSACYPWRIDKTQPETVVFEILPNNTPTTATYRICLCPPADGVSLQLDLDDKRVTLGSVELNGGGMICRDFRVMSSRRSRLLLARTGQAGSAVEGCYNTN